MVKHLMLAGFGLAMLACTDNKSGGDPANNDTTNANKVETPANTDTDSQAWESLFDGSTVKGWHKYGNKPAGSAWTVDDGTLHLNPAARKGGNGGDLVSDKEYEDFHLKMEWKIAKNGNSGIMFYVNEDTTKYRNTYETGPEMQVLDNDGHPDAKIAKHRAGDLYDLIAVSQETVKPLGEWNQVEIKCKNGALEFWLNGTSVVKTTLWDDAWKTMVANSKFKSMPGFGTYKKGRIALQDHGDEVWYRNIQIKKI